MDNAEKEALINFLQVVLSILVRNGRTEDQARLLEAWQELYGSIIGDN